MKETRPTHGGSYHRQDDGTLKLVEGPPESREAMKSAHSEPDKPSKTKVGK